MYLAKYLWKRSKTWYKDKFFQQFEKLEPYFHWNRLNIQESIENLIFSHLDYSDLSNNITTIKIKNTNIWLRIKWYSKLNYELFTYEDNQEKIILNNEEINHKLCYEHIIKPNRHIIYQNENLSYWKIRELNESNIYHLICHFWRLDILTFQALKPIEINIVKLMDIKDKYRDFKDSRVLFITALREEKNVDILKNYYFFFEGFNKIESKNLFIELFQHYPLTSEQVHKLTQYDRTTSKCILDHTEKTFELTEEKPSYYYDTLYRRIKNKEFEAYFMLLRLAYLGKIESVPEKMLDSIDNEMAENFDKLTTALLLICTTPQLQESFFSLSDYYGEVELNNWTLGYESKDLKKVLYRAIKYSHYSLESHTIGKVVLELMSSSVFPLDNMLQAEEVLNYFHLNYNFKNLKLKIKLERKLLPKIQQEKVKKI